MSTSSIDPTNVMLHYYNKCNIGLSTFCLLYATSPQQPGTTADPISHQKYDMLHTPSNCLPLQHPSICKRQNRSAFSQAQFTLPFGTTTHNSHPLSATTTTIIHSLNFKREIDKKRMSGLRVSIGRGQRPIRWRRISSLCDAEAAKLERCHQIQTSYMVSELRQRGFEAGGGHGLGSWLHFSHILMSGGISCSGWSWALRL